MYQFLLRALELIAVRILMVGAGFNAEQGMPVCAVDAENACRATEGMVGVCSFLLGAEGPG